jgi:hypothetical protein
LDEVLAGFGALGCPELDLQFPMTRVHDHFRWGGRFLVLTRHLRFIIYWI